jgi:hypothetical protein
LILQKFSRKTRNILSRISRSLNSFAALSTDIVERHKTLNRSRTLSTTLSLVCVQRSSFHIFVDRALAHCTQRPSGLAQRRLPQMFMRGTKFQLRTTLSAVLLPPLRQTASYVLAFVCFPKRKPQFIVS